MYDYYEYFKYYMMFVILVTLNATMRLRQVNMRNFFFVKPHQLAFPHVTRALAETDLEHMLKYLMNYVFYKFCLEIVLVTIVCIITLRQDIMSLFYCFWLLIFMPSSRKLVATLLPFFMLSLVSLIMVQCLLDTGFPPGLCQEYLLKDNVNSGPISAWTLLPSQTHHRKKNMIWDFVLLYMCQRMRIVFKIENNDYSDSYPGGSNKPVYNESQRINPTRNFMGNKREGLDIFLTLMLGCFYWATLAVTLLAGTGTGDILTLGYLIFVFVFLWESTDFFLRPINEILKRWSWLMAYNVGVIIFKSLSQIAGCIFLDELQKNCCWLVQLLGIVCNVYQELDDTQKPKKRPTSNICPTMNQNSIARWNALCFVFHIFMLRLFKSDYFSHIILHTRAGSVLFTRGAVFIENLHQKNLLEYTAFEIALMTRFRRMTRSLRRNAVRLKIEVQDAAQRRARQMNPQEGTENESKKTIKFLVPSDENDTKGENTPQKGGSESLNIPSAKVKSARKKKKSKRRITPRQSLRSEAVSIVDDYDTNIDEMARKNRILIVTYGIFLSLARFFYRFSRDYRFAKEILTMERQKLQEFFIEQGKVSSKPKDHRAFRQYIDEIEQAANAQFIPKDKEIMENVLKGRIDDQQHAEQVRPEHGPFVEMIHAIWYTVVANTEYVCYGVVFYVQIKNPSSMLLILNFIVLLWATLSIPRATKIIWVGMISFVEFVVLFKYITGFSGIFVSSDEDMIETESMADLLVLLLTFFLHSYMLKMQGLWITKDKDVFEAKPSQMLVTKKSSDANASKWKVFNLLKAAATIPTVKKQKQETATNSGDVSDDDSDSSESELTRMSCGFPDRQQYLIGLLKKEKASFLPVLQVLIYKILHNPRLPSDVYFAMFSTQLLSFTVLMLFYESFFVYNEYSESSFKILIGAKVTLYYVLALLAYFSLIILDRIIYLRKALRCKLVFYIIFVIGLHVWLFYTLHMFTGSYLKSLPAPIGFYILSCIYMLLSAYQIKAGYPKRILRNCLTKHFGRTNFLIFELYRKVPVFYELRILLDFFCTHTSLNMKDWVRFEDIFGQIYMIKCLEVQLEAIDTAKSKLGLYFKLLMGGLLFCFILALMWGPLYVFAYFNDSVLANNPFFSQLTISINTITPIYMTSTRDKIRTFTETDMDQMKEIYKSSSILKNHKKVESFLESFQPENVVSITFVGASPSAWLYQPRELKALKSLFRAGEPLLISFILELQRNPSPKDALGRLLVTSEIMLEPDSDAYLLFKELFDSDYNFDTYIRVENFIPKFMRAYDSPKLAPIAFLAPDTYNTLLLKYSHMVSRPAVFWVISEEYNTTFQETHISKMPHATNDTAVVFYVFSTPTPKIDKLRKFMVSTGIVGAYTGIFLLITFFLKSFFTTKSRDYMYTKEALPHVNRIWNVCLDILFVREAVDFASEKELFSQLIILYESQELWEGF